MPVTGNQPKVSSVRGGAQAANLQGTSEMGAGQEARTLANRETLPLAS